jgi:hypothetical protein
MLQRRGISELIINEIHRLFIIIIASPNNNNNNNNNKIIIITFIHVDKLLLVFYYTVAWTSTMFSLIYLLSF